MRSVEGEHRYTWLTSGTEYFSEVLRAIEAAKESIRLETYCFTAEAPGQRIRDALVRARQRAVPVRVLIDGVGSRGLAAGFWTPFVEAGGELRWFNPPALRRFWFRDHRKMIVCDERTAFLGGFNIAAQYEGDGIHSGWRDVGLRIDGPVAEQLAVAFEEMFTRADFQHKLFTGLRRAEANQTWSARNQQLLLSGPGRAGNPIKRALHRDLKEAGEVQIIMAYFLPTWRLRRRLLRVAGRGGRVQLILAGKSDVRLSQLAGQSLYRRFLRRGVEVYEYLPQILHAKLIVVDDAVYIGSCNLDQRSLQINYELMLRVRDRAVAADARAIFNATLTQCRRIEREPWQTSRSLWQKLKQRLAYWLLVRVDPYLARWFWRRLAD